MGHSRAEKAQSRERIVTAAARQIREGGLHKGSRTLKSIVDSYLSPAHRDGAGTGCAIASLAADVGRDDPVCAR